MANLGLPEQGLESMYGAEIPRSTVERLIDEWILGRNAMRNRDIMKCRICDGMTYEQIAEVFDLSVRQVKNIVYKNEEIIYRKAKSI